MAGLVGTYQPAPPCPGQEKTFYSECSSFGKLSFVHLCLEACCSVSTKGKYLL